MRGCTLLVLLLIVTACGAMTRPGGGDAARLSDADLRYRLVDTYGPPAYCDPYDHPVARLEDAATAAQEVAALRARDPSAFAAIVAHEHLDAASLSPDDDRLIARQARQLAALSLVPDGSDLAFRYVVATGSGDEVSGSIDREGRSRLAGRSPNHRPPCPICLAEGTTIATPAGPRRVQDVRPGVVVWTLAHDGARVPAPVVATGHAAAPPGHRLVHLALADGRAVAASPGHPAANGRSLGSLVPGDRLDGSTVVRADLVAYAGANTWDVLPAGSTGVYWAGGIPLRSTLLPNPSLQT